MIMLLTDYEFHPAADEFPMMDKERLDELIKDISINGQREPICLYQGKILDGRNRMLACQALGIAPKTRTLPEDIDPWSYVWSLNGERRDLTAAQRYLIWKACHEKSEAWQAEQQRIRDEANRKRSEATKERERAEDGTLKASSGCTSSAPTGDRESTKSRAAKAKASKTNRGTVERMDRLVRERPDLAEKVKVGEINEAAAIREMKREKIIKELESIKVKEAKALEGVFDVIVIDPPWPMKKIERDERPNQSEFDYPTMNEDELRELKIPCANDCHVWLWTTHKFLPMAFRLLDHWGLKYVCTFVWHKPGGFQPFGLPQYNCEFALYARKGSPAFIDTRKFMVCFSAQRGKHSEKPDEFYQMIRLVTAGRRLDMFNRRKIDGFDTWGNQAS